jgi:hypothetical protein
MEATRSSETSTLSRAKRHHIPEDDVLHSQRSENLKSYTWLVASVYGLDVLLTAGHLFLQLDCWNLYSDD